MIMKFFELKYRALEIFYDHICELNYSYSEAVGKTYYELHQQIRDKGIEMIIIYITIGKRLYKHNSISEDDLNEIKEAIYLYETTNFKSFLNEYENEVLCEEITELKIDLKI